MEAKQDVLAKGRFLAPKKHSDFDTAQHETVIALEDLLQPVSCMFCAECPELDAEWPAVSEDVSSPLNDA